MSPIHPPNSGAANTKPASETLTDVVCTVATLRELVATFVDERDWNQFHAPKNLAMSIAIEAAELMEHFQWGESEASRRLRDDPRRFAEASSELADVLAYVLALANQLDIDLSSTLHAKMLRNAAKYPVEEYLGRAGGDQKWTRREHPAE